MCLLQRLWSGTDQFSHNAKKLESNIDFCKILSSAIAVRRENVEGNRLFTSQYENTMKMFRYAKFVVCKNLINGKKRFQCFLTFYVKP